MNALDGTTDAGIQISLKVFGGLRGTLGASDRRIAVPQGSCLRDLISQLAAQNAVFADRLEIGLAKGYLNVLVNGRNVRFLNHMDTLLEDNDVVAILPPVGGG